MEIMVLGTKSFMFFLTMLKYEVIRFFIILISIWDLGEELPISSLVALIEKGIWGKWTGLMLD